ncbi:M15 family metallopeptidase [Cellulomonas sp. McL0617]|uniref:M15 family metallopeptidase n=1 Tax=Cellulomonas sp. McL0617 TaxID=3415675 RepID=UPI003CF95D4E
MTTRVRPGPGGLRRARGGVHGLGGYPDLTRGAVSLFAVPETDIRRPARSITAAVTAVLVVGVAGGAWAWDAHRDDVAAQQTAQSQAEDRAAAVVDAQDADVDGAVGRDAALDRAQAAAVLAVARADLQQASDTASATLVATDGQVGDDAVRQALVAQVTAADAALGAVPAAPSDNTPASSPGTTSYGAADLRTFTAALAAANAAVLTAHDAWSQQQVAASAAAKAAKAATPKPPKVAAPTKAPSCGTTYTGPPFYTSPPTVGGDGSNGKLPPSALTAISWTKDPHGTPYYLRSDAAAALERLDVAFRSAFGHNLGLDLTYRDYDTQVAMRAALGTVAAVPGTSTHGTGLALDVPELPCEYGWDTPQRTWLVTHGPTYGWTSPAWAHQNGSNPEYWHFDYVG